MFVCLSAEKFNINMSSMEKCSSAIGRMLCLWFVLLNGQTSSAVLQSYGDWVVNVVVYHQQKCSDSWPGSLCFMSLFVYSSK